MTVAPPTRLPPVHSYAAVASNVFSSAATVTAGKFTVPAAVPRLLGVSHSARPGGAIRKAVMVALRTLNGTGGIERDGRS